MFATHICLLWMSTKVLRGDLISYDINDNQKLQLENIVKNVKSLINYDDFLERLKELTDKVTTD